ncbi:hypothetical protein EDD18DRAFT_1107648 [Armillaria luteobubalina]|uniref:Uncharacterized protein n=1 Tax=Armillaria luteobubalina TaxID=153913 RepID=A0AA39ULE6_9AGAR|nr:hypothetical protein EDD18DRAFT_1107648 [Armillaria luteobubalina]
MSIVGNGRIKKRNICQAINREMRKGAYLIQHMDTISARRKEDSAGFTSPSLGLQYFTESIPKGTSCTKLSALKEMLGSRGESSEGLTKDDSVAAIAAFRYHSKKDRTVYSVAG